MRVGVCNNGVSAGIRVHPIPLDVFVGQSALLRFGHAAAEPFGDMHGADQESGVCPVDAVKFQRVIAAACSVGALDGDVVVGYLSAGGRRTVAVGNNAANGV